MKHDRKIIISAAGSRKATSWPQQNIYWSELVEKLRTPVRSTETLQEYLKLSKAKQDDLKDVGGFVAGSLKGNKRGSNTVIGRDIITLDLDNIPAGETQNTLFRIDGLGCGYAVYSTRKHEPIKPRLRVLLPLNRTCTADEYEPIARKIASIIGIELCDPTTFQASRLMYWPSCCSDSQYVYQFRDKPFLDADGILNLYIDWRNISEWPQVPGAPQAQVKLASKQSDPESKSGVVGAFCKIYDVYKAIDTFIPDAYTTCDIDDRLTYTGGSTTAGAIIYDNGKFIYSHHATDPAGGKLCNAFDLVRLHKFGEMDEDAKPDTPTNKLPSYIVMCELAVADSFVAALMDQERYENATKGFEKPLIGDENWMQQMSRNGTDGSFAKTLNNYKTIINNDPNFKGKIRFNLLSGKIDILEVLPWVRASNSPLWADTDTPQLRVYIEPIIGKVPKNDIADAVSACAGEHAYHPVRDYLNNLSWDGISRLDTLFIDYLGAADTEYIRAVTRKSFTAAVARVMTPGIKFDNMTIIIGSQGRHKSTILSKMGGEWFSDSLRNFGTKESMETIQGTWINEIAEMQAMNNSEIDAVKAFLSKLTDYYRPSYGQFVADKPRQCVFFGTTNTHDCLRDTTGGRRFWPVDIDQQQRKKDVFVNLDDERDQLWAEAVMRWKLGGPLRLPSNVEYEAGIIQEEHRERHPWEGEIEKFVAKPVPEDWMNWELDKRLVFWGGGMIVNGELTERTRICATEIWCECLVKTKGDFQQRQAREINRILEKLKGWKNIGVREAGKPYGKQRCFERKML